MISNQVNSYFKIEEWYTGKAGDKLKVLGAKLKKVHRLRYRGIDARLF